MKVSEINAVWQVVPVNQGRAAGTLFAKGDIAQSLVWDSKVADHVEGQTILRLRSK